MSRAVTWALVIAGLVVLLGVGAALGSRDEGEPVSAGEYADNVCDGVGAWRGSIESIVDDIRDPAALGDTGSEEPQSETPQGRTGFIRLGLERAVQATETLTEGISRAGVPDTPQGAEAAQRFQDWADGAHDELEKASDTLDSEPDSLEQSLQAVAGAARTVADTIAGGVRTVGEVAQTDPQLVPAFRNASSCQELQADRGAS